MAQQQEQLNPEAAKKVFSIPPPTKILLETCDSEFKTSSLVEVLEPPTIEIATQIFNNLFFSSDRYDLSDVGRVKLN